MQIGPYEIFTLETGFFRLDGGAMFGVVPKALWQKTNPADEDNRILLALRTMVIRDEEHVILVDTGIGRKMNEKLSRIYAVDHSEHELLTALAGKGISREEVTDVILTHLHFDHAGGGTILDEQNKLQLTFPNARYHVQGEQWYWANNPVLKDRASFIPDNFEPIIEAGRLNELSGPGTLLPGIDLLVMYGHTHGMQLPKISHKGTTLLYCADLVPTASHIPLPYIMGYDNNPLFTLQEKERILPQAVKGEWILVFEHDPYHKAGIVEETEKGFHLKNEVNI